MTSELAKKQCSACEGNEEPLKGDAVQALSDKLGNDWKVVDEHHLEKTYTFDDFKQALEFTNRVGEVAEAQEHHPDIYLAYGKVEVKVWTHKIDGLAESDFVFAAKCDEVV